MSGITTHVLDTSLGRPARGMPVRLELRSGENEWVPVGAGETDDDGRLGTLTSGVELEAADYRLTFDVGDYLAMHDREGFFPQVTITFRVQDVAQHYHVPLLLSPFGYSTYRGS